MRQTEGVDEVIGPRCQGGHCSGYVPVMEGYLDEEGWPSWERRVDIWFLPRYEEFE